jgi:hypothetical protein
MSRAIVEGQSGGQVDDGEVLLDPEEEATIVAVGEVDPEAEESADLPVVEKGTDAPTNPEKVDSW